MLRIGFIKPHHPFDAPAPWSEQYNPDELSLLPWWTNDILPNDYQLYKGFFDNKSLTKPIAKKKFLPNTMLLFLKSMHSWDILSHY
jgi:hypothetical protein